MRQPFLSPVSLTACAAILTGAMVAPTADASSTAEAQRLESLRALLAQEKAQKTGDRSLTVYFTHVAAEFRAAGYTNIARLLDQSGAQAVSALDNQQAGRSLAHTRRLSRLLSQAVATQSGSSSVATPEYLQLASVFANNLSKAAKNVANGRPVTQGIGERPQPLTDVSTPADQQASGITSGAQEFRATDPVTYGVTKSGTGALTLSGGVVTVTGGSAGTGTVTLVTSSGTATSGNNIIAPSPTPAASSSDLGFPSLITGTVTIGQFTTVSPSFDTTVDSTADLIIPAGSSLAIAAGHAFALLGTLSVDLAKSVQVILTSPAGALQGVTDVSTTQIPVIGTSTSTFHLEPGSIIEVHHAAPGSYVILSGFQSTGNMLGNVAITGLAAGQTASLSESNGVVTLTLTQTDLSLTPPGFSAGDTLLMGGTGSIGASTVFADSITGTLSGTLIISGAASPTPSPTP